jgi:hypothetical protein
MDRPAWPPTTSRCPSFLSPTTEAAEPRTFPTTDGVVVAPRAASLQRHPVRSVGENRLRRDRAQVPRADPSRSAATTAVLPFVYA